MNLLNKVVEAGITGGLFVVTAAAYAQLAVLALVVVGVLAAVVS